MKKLFTLFAIMMIAVTASAKELSFYNWTKNGRTFTQTIDGVTFNVSYNSWTTSVSGTSLTFNWKWDNDYDEDEDEALPGEVTVTVSSENASFTGAKFSLNGIWYTSTEVDSWQFTIPADSRPTLVFDYFTAYIQDTPTGITEVNATSSHKTGKFLKDGKLIIVKDGKQYNAAGQKM